VTQKISAVLGSPVRAIARFSTLYLDSKPIYPLAIEGGHTVYRSGWLPPVTSQRLQLIISTEHESTGLEAERELLNNVFEFGDVTAAEVVVKRTSIVTLPVTATFETLLKKWLLTGYSRYPVIGKSLDDIRGIVHFKELAEPGFGKVIFRDTNPSLDSSHAVCTGTHTFE
jgi:hypothetical protein